ncbi:sugar ABC transporter substrate-binding protein [Clostridium sp. AM58-1XD]|uniref:sugar ABC transporter substrate-binding protein n=1 Tax=Clostridium sp. AM58-1XD TaxID=2292307 RepID=UPI000E4AE0AF|nr:sugar ABC transporter substrate-binding protein [Clostridium sp. AM58-1XD]RGY98576.1 sugar ABC transporter substrate-binding protein [Clostridium sp. AM58-1XD]
MALVLVTAMAAAGCGSGSSGATEAEKTEKAAETSVETAAETKEKTDTGGEESQGAKDKEREPMEIALITKTLTIPYFVTNKEYLEKYVAELHPEDKVTTFDSNQDVTRELSIVEDCITQGYDVIILTPIDYEGSCAAVQKIVDAGIPCILVESTANMEIADMTIMADNHEAGYLAMNALGEAMGGKGKMVVFHNSTNPVASQRAAGRDDCLKEKYPDIEIVNVEDGAHTVDKCFEVMSNFLIADPDITGAWCFQDPNAQGVASAVKTAGLTGQVNIVGVDGSDEVCELIKSGEAVGTAARWFLRSIRFWFRICTSFWKKENWRSQIWRFLACLSEAITWTTTGSTGRTASL